MKCWGLTILSEAWRDLGRVLLALPLEVKERSPKPHGPFLDRGTATWDPRPTLPGILGGVGVGVEGREGQSIATARTQTE